MKQYQIDRIKDLMDAKGVSSKELASKCGLSEMTIRRVLDPKHNPTTDNIEKIATMSSFFNNVLGTTQAQPVGNLYNFGGFTDGDRAIFLAVALGASEITLAGMDFGDIVTKYSRPNLPDVLGQADEFKKKKLMYAEKFTNWISENEDVEIINLKE